MPKILVIQTAFIGDVILATSILEHLHHSQPNAQIHMCVRKGNEGLLKGHPFLKKVLVWDKGEGKTGNLLRLLTAIRKEKYDSVFNAQRFFSTGILTAFSGAKRRVGFKDNPLSFGFTERVNHQFGDGTHEVSRLLMLLNHNGDSTLPKLYPSTLDYQKADEFTEGAFVCLAPGSVWFTKRWPENKWVELMNLIPTKFRLLVIGGKDDSAIAQRLMDETGRGEDLCGKLSLLQTAALISKAIVTVANDSAPTHLASAMNAPIITLFCSTVPNFGFGPISDQKWEIQIENKLDCRPCGMHGKSSCPKGHFKCAEEIDVNQIVDAISNI